MIESIAAKNELESGKPVNRQPLTMIVGVEGQWSLAYYTLRRETVLHVPTVASFAFNEALYAFHPSNSYISDRSPSDAD